ncbi:MAG: hypothetical protein KIS62_01385 [Ramlibacter sp.]|nr:hypothetical protein [Ramlibacter sp.]
MTTPAAHIEVTDDDLRRAFAVCRARTWPERFEDAMAEAYRAQIITACAHGLRRKAQRPVAAAPSGPPVSQQPLVAHWPPRRVMPADFVDHKRAAAGDRDDD